MFIHEYEFSLLSSSVFKFIIVILMFMLFISGYVVHIKISSYSSMNLDVGFWLEFCPAAGFSDLLFQFNTENPIHILITWSLLSSVTPNMYVLMLTCVFFFSSTTFHFTIFFWHITTECWCNSTTAVCCNLWWSPHNHLMGLPQQWPCNHHQSCWPCQSPHDQWT
jgi:hypothetical protein